MPSERQAQAAGILETNAGAACGNDAAIAQSRPRLPSDGKTATIQQLIGQLAIERLTIAIFRWTAMFKHRIGRLFDDVHAVETTL